MGLKSIGLVVIGVLHYSPANALSVAEQTEMINAHNKYRAAVGVPVKVRWSESLGDMAQEYANQLKRKHDCGLTHSRSEGFGENLYWASPIIYSSGKTETQKVTPQQVADSWASEQQDYDYLKNSCASGKVCGHYTQMVWSKTSELGCGKAVCGDKSQVWVCNYYPAGNFVGKKPY